jgi:hypothetical protein
MKRFLAFLLLCLLCLVLLVFVACGTEAPNGPQKETVTAHEGEIPPPPPPPSGGGGG